jgi:hypothetical protein
MHTYKPLPPVEVINQWLIYDEHTGELRWREKINWSIRKNQVAGNINNSGYLKIQFLKGSYLAHRLIWKLQTGNDPVEQIDHIDGCTTNNAWSNLRLASPKQNSENTFLRTNNKSGFRGVYFDTEKGKWRAVVCSKGKKHFVGFFDNPEQAGKAAQQKRNELFTHNTQRETYKATQ